MTSESLTSYNGVTVLWSDKMWNTLRDSTTLCPDANVINVMLDCYAKSKRVDRALSLFKEMRDRRGAMAPTNYTYSILVSAMAKSGDVRSSERLLLLAIKDLGAAQCPIMMYQV